MLCKDLWTKKPEALYDSIVCEENKELTKLRDSDLEKLTRLSRKSWRIRSLRYAEIIPDHLFKEDPNTSFFKSKLKLWIISTIPPEGDGIFKGKLEQKADEDWLTQELTDWKKNEKHETESREEWMEVEGFYEAH